MKANVTVKNINGLRQATCSCGTWLAHWRNYSILPLPLHCPKAGCRERPEVGAFVQTAEAGDLNWYVLPLCRKHSESKAPLEVSPFTPLVSANVKETCAKG